MEWLFSVRLRRLTNKPEPLRVDDEPLLGYAEGMALLARHTESLLGPKPADRNVRIMVTMPSEAADNYPLVLDLLKSGMNCIRINCAYDDAKTLDQDDRQAASRDRRDRKELSHSHGPAWTKVEDWSNVTWPAGGEVATTRIGVNDRCSDS